MYIKHALFISVIKMKEIQLGSRDLVPGHLKAQSDFAQRNHTRPASSKSSNASVRNLYERCSTLLRIGSFHKFLPQCAARVLACADCMYLPFAKASYTSLSSNCYMGGIQICKGCNFPQEEQRTCRNVSKSLGENSNRIIKSVLKQNVLGRPSCGPLLPLERENQGHSSGARNESNHAD